MMRVRTELRGRPASRLIACVTIAAIVASAGACSEPESGTGVDDATIAIAVQSAPRSLDPSQLQGGQQAFVWNSIYDTLLYLDNDGELQPNAAKSWEYSRDGLTLTLTLRKGMTFSSGDPVDATAVKTTMERSIATPGEVQGRLSVVESIDTPDDHTVVLRLRERSPALLTELALEPGVIGNPVTLDDERTTTNPVGSGPYVLDADATVNASTYVLQRRDDYWNVEAYPFQTVTVRVMADRTATVNALQAGEIDVGTVDANQVTKAKAAGFEITTVDAKSVAYLNLADRGGELLPALNDVRVRQAINFAFDREKMVKQLLFGAGAPTVQQFNPQGDAYDEKLESTYGYDPERARELLAEAGYADGFAVTMPSTVMSKPFEPTITQALADISITVRWEPVPAQNAVAAIAAKEFPAFVFLTSLDTTAREVSRQLMPGEPQNPFAVEDPQLVALIERVNAEPDPRRAADLYQEINAYVVETALFAPLFYISGSWATTAEIQYLGNGSNNRNVIQAFGLAE